MVANTQWTDTRSSEPCDVSLKSKLKLGGGAGGRRVKFLKTAAALKIEKKETSAQNREYYTKLKTVASTM